MNYVANKNKGLLVELFADGCFFIYLITELMFKHTIIGQLGLISFAVSVALLMMSKGKIRSSFYFPLIMIFLIYSLFIATSDYAISNSTSISILPTVTLNILTMFLVYNYLVLRAKVNRTINLFINAALVFGVINLLTTPLSSGFSSRLGGDKSNILSLSCSLALVMCFYFYLRGKGRKINMVRIMILTSIIILTGTRKGLLLVVISSVILIYLMYPGKRTRNILLILVFSFIGYLIIMNVPIIYNSIGVRVEQLLNYTLGENVDEASMLSRIKLIEVGWEYITERPWQGYGLGSFVYLPYSGGTYSHNNYIEMLFTGGIIGTTLYYISYLIAVIKGYMLSRKYEIVCLFVSIQVAFLIIDYAWVSYIERIPLTIFMYLLAVIKLTNINQVRSKYKGVEINEKNTILD
ncbi:O-antigen ligase family protein [Bacillus sp. NTK071]|uniref:O-antigen ligase family protein n=1 Tax=Bacillus sp. NTK071 TaxID=2802175 RepID=UPI001A8F3354|nr:O-antigen ligase family protein [Bacillus sp. NTK071]MBN8210242.1 O-antigen ligase family protein [Bacillus sp. NTK071]